MLTMHIGGVRHVIGLVNCGGQAWIPCPDNPQHLWTESEWKAVANFQKASLEFERRKSDK